MGQGISQEPNVIHDTGEKKSLAYLDDQEGSL